MLPATFKNVVCKTLTCKNQKEDDMTDQKMEAHIYCPFFGHLNPHTISCEYLGKELGILVRFDSQAHKVRTLLRWCFSQTGHRRCPVAGANYRFYEKVQNGKKKGS